MSWLTLPLLLAAATPAITPAPAAKSRIVYEQVSATVQILAAEEIRFDEAQTKTRAVTGKINMRQTRYRGTMPLVEFY